MRRATVYDVAKKAGVSTATVSFTFRRPDKVKPSTRAKVLRAAKDLDYVPSANARGLARGNTGVLGLYSFDMLIERPLGDEDDFDSCSGGNDVVSENGKPIFSNRAGESFDCPSVLSYPLYVDEVQRGFELECRRRNRAVLLGTAIRHDGWCGYHRCSWSRGWFSSVSKRIHQHYAIGGFVPKHTYRASERG